LAKKIRLLIVEDNSDDVVLILHAIKKGGYDVDYKQVASGLEMRSALDTEEWDIILSDYALPQFGGLEALQITLECNSDLPFILVSGAIGEERAVEVIHSGAYDYVMKDNLVRLVSVIERALNDALLRSDGARDREALEKSESRYRSMLARSHEIVQHVDAEGRILTVNQNWLNALGYREEEVRGRFIWDFMLPEIKVFCIEKLNALQSGATLPNMEMQLLDKQGETVFLEGNIGSFMRGDVFVESHGYFRNITERRRADNALRENEAKLNALVENMPHGICLLDVENVPVMYNRQAFEDLSLLCDNFGSQPITDIGTTKWEDMITALAEQKFYDIPLTGSNRIFQVFARSIENNGDHEGSVLGIIEVTHEREILESVKRQDRLAAVGQLAAGIAHDFNNVLSVMMGFAQVLCLRDDIDEKYKEDLNRIYTQGKRANQLVRQVLDFSSQTVVNRQTIELGVFANEITQLLERLLPENIETEIHLNAELQEIEGDVTQIQQIITNIAINARDAMPDGGVLGVQLQNVDTTTAIDDRMPTIEARKWVVLQISDDGCGMTDEVANHIFEPFYTTKKDAGGTGLGMAQVYGIVQQHDAHIHVVSAPGKGTTFSIFFPHKTSKEASFDLIKPVIQNKNKSTPQPKTQIEVGQGETILLVEDEKAVMEVASELLKTLNYQVICAEDGREVLDFSNDKLNEIDLIITDFIMPNVGGKELCIGLAERNITTPIIIMSGYMGDENSLQAEQLQHILWIEKPIDRKKLANAVHVTLNEQLS
jgi:two-component system, cell cycle sensor histidine kinase and response regulator CckA